LSFTEKRRGEREKKEAIERPFRGKKCTKIEK